MDLTIIGTGNMGRGIGTRLVGGGHAVQLVGSGPGKADGLAEELRGRASDAARVSAGDPGDPIGSDVVVLPVHYGAAAPIVESYGDQLSGKVIVDITNPIDFATMEPGAAADSSGAEEIAKAAPADAKVVKALNTTFAGALETGTVAGQQLDVLIAGDDAGAKATVAELVESSGLRAVDVGPLRPGAPARRHPLPAHLRPGRPRHGIRQRGQDHLLTGVRSR